MKLSPPCILVKSERFYGKDFCASLGIKSDKVEGKKTRDQQTFSRPVARSRDHIGEFRKFPSVFRSSHRPLHAHSLSSPCCCLSSFCHKIFHQQRNIKKPGSNNLNNNNGIQHNTRSQEEDALPQDGEGKCIRQSRSAGTEALRSKDPLREGKVFISISVLYAVNTVAH